MPYDPERHHRRSVRWRDHDYAAGGTYFVILCTEDRACVFGDVRDGQMHPNPIGLLIERLWMQSERYRAELSIDVFAVMPNHLHGLVTIAEPAEQSEMGSTSPAFSQRRPKSLASAIAQFKASSTVAVNNMRGMPGVRLWQRGYHEHVVRDTDAFDRIAWYIVTNPERWNEDPDNPAGGARHDGP